MLSIMTVRINEEFAQEISISGQVTLSGILSFNYYEKKEIVDKKINFRASYTAVSSIINSHLSGVAIGYTDVDNNKAPVFKIQQFIPSLTSVEADDLTEDLAVEVV